MVSQIYFLKCLQISSTQIKHTYNYSAAVNKLPVIWNSIFYLTHIHKKGKNRKKRRKVKEKKEVSSSGALWLHDKEQSQSFRTQSGVLWFQHSECLRHGLSEPRSCKGLAGGGAGSQAALPRGGGSPPCLLMPLPVLALPWGAAATLTGAPPGEAHPSAAAHGGWLFYTQGRMREAGGAALDATEGGWQIQSCHVQWLLSHHGQTSFPSSLQLNNSCPILVFPKIPVKDSGCLEMEWRGNAKQLPWAAVRVVGAAEGARTPVSLPRRLRWVEFSISKMMVAY